MALTQWFTGQIPSEARQCFVPAVIDVTITRRSGEAAQVEQQLCSLGRVRGEGEGDHRRRFDGRARFAPREHETLERFDLQEHPPVGNSSPVSSLVMV